MRTVELLGADGAVSGRLEVAAAHTAPGHLHRAFSVVLLDDHGRTLLQRRAAEKSAFAGLWSNSCCSHPVGSEPIEQQAALRCRQELGITVELVAVGAFTYRAADPVSGLVEHEHDTVLVGRLPDAPLQPDPAELSETRLAPLGDALADVAARPSSYTPWLRQTLECAAMSDMCNGR